MKHETVTPGKRRTIELALDEKLLDDAAALGIDLDELADRALAVEVKRERDKRWKEENREALASWTRWIDKHGSPLDRHRAF